MSSYETSETAAFKAAFVDDVVDLVVTGATLVVTMGAGREIPGGGWRLRTAASSASASQDMSHEQREYFAQMDAWSHPALSIPITTSIKI